MLASAVTQGQRGEPIALLEGVSIWPTVLIRLLATALAIWFICRSWRALTANLDAIARTFKWEEPEEALDRQQRKEQQAAWPTWRRVVRIFSYRLDEQRLGESSPRLA